MVSPQNRRASNGSLNQSPYPRYATLKKCQIPRKQDPHQRNISESHEQLELGATPPILDDEIERGWRLICIGSPLSDCVLDA